MPSGKLSYRSSGLHRWFNPTLYRKNMARFWPIWAAYGAILFVMLPLSLLTNYAPDPAATVAFGYEAEEVVLSGAAYFARAVVPQTTTHITWIFGIVMGCLTAMAVFSYLFQARSVGLMHALPMKREGLFLTNYLSGLSFFAFPLLAIFFVTLIAEAVLGEVFFPALFTWLVVSLLTTFFFYSFAVFCAMFTGHILALPAFYAILNGLAYGLYAVLTAVFSEFIYGYANSGGPLENIVRWLSPVANLSSRLTLAPAGRSYCVSGLFPVFLYALVGIVLTACAMALYHKRQLEAAGDVVSVSWIRPVFRYGVAVCAALALGMLLYGLVKGNASPQIWVFLLCAILCGVLGYYAADMLLRKSFRVFRKNWRGPVLVSAILAVGVLCLAFDVTGYERRIPSPDQVASASLWSISSYPDDSARHAQIQLDDPEDIALLNQLQAALIEERIDNSNYYVPDSYQTKNLGTGPIDVATRAYKDVALYYGLKNGAYASRRYTVLVDEARLSDPSSAAGILNALVNRPDVVEDLYFNQMSAYLEGGGEVRLTDAAVTALDSYRSGSREYTFPLDLNQEGRDALLEAVHADIAAGNLGKRYLLENEARYTGCYFNDLVLTYYSSALKASNPDTNGYFTVTLTLQATAKETLAAVEAGGLDPAKLATLAEAYTDGGGAGTVYAEESPG